MPATCGDLPSSGAPSRRKTCWRWLKRSSSPCLPRATKPEQQGVVFQHSRRWPPWARSHNCGGIGYGAYQKHQWIPREIANLEDLTSSNSWVKAAPGWGNGRSMRWRFYHSLPCADGGKSHLFDDPTSPRQVSRSKESRGTNIKSHVDSGPRLKHGPRGYAESRRVKHQQWVEQPSSKWVWPSSCKGRRGVRRDDILGEEWGARISDGSDCLGDTSCGGGGDGTTSQSRTCTRLPPTILNACRLRDCLGQPMRAVDGDKRTSATYGRPALPSSLRPPQENKCNKMVSSVQGQAQARAVEAPVELPVESHWSPTVVSNLVEQGSPKHGSELPPKRPRSHY